MKQGSLVSAVAFAFVSMAAITAARLTYGFGQPTISIVSPTYQQLVEGKSYDVRWTNDGAKNITVVATGHLTDFPQKPRGNFRIVLTKNSSVGRGSVNWEVPFLDTVKFKIVAKGYDNNGKPIISSREYIFRPAVISGRHKDGIYIDVRDESRQRLYVLKGDKLTHAYLTSGSRANEYFPRNIHPAKPHDHDGVFNIIDKHPVWHSKLFDVDMIWAMRYWSGHFIHGTSPNHYKQLGTPASSGCNRLTKEQAKELYDMTPVGTMVEIIAKNSAV